MAFRARIKLVDVRSVLFSHLTYSSAEREVEVVAGLIFHDFFFYFSPGSLIIPITKQRERAQKKKK